MKLPFLLRLVFNRYLFEKAAAFALLGLFLYLLSDFLFIFLITFLFAYLFSDFSKWIMERIATFASKTRNKAFKSLVSRANRPGVVVTVLYLTFVIGVVWIFSNLVPQILEESKGIVSEIPGIVDRVNRTAASIEDSMNVELGLKEAIGSMFDQHSIQTSMNLVFENVRTAGILLAKILIALILSYVFIMDQKRIVGYLETVKRGNFSFLYDEIGAILAKVSKGFGLIFKAQALIALVNALLTAAGLLVISAVHGGDVFPYISTLAVMVFIMGFIPVLGFILSSVPLLIVGFNYGGNSVVLMVLGMIAFVHAVEAYYLNPKIVSSYMEFPVFITFIVLLVSEHVFGFVGLLIGVPLFYLLIDVAKDFDVFVNKIKRVSNTIDTTKTTTKEAIHKNIRLSRSQGPGA